MASISQKVRIFNFAAEQSLDHKLAIRTALHEPILGSFQYNKLKLGIWYLTQSESFEIPRYYPYLSVFELHPQKKIPKSGDIEINDH